MILVMAGTSDGRLIAKEINREYSVIASVTTEYGKSLLEAEGLNVLMGKMDFTELKDFIKDNNISALVDATHPYAENASRNAINACKESKITYIRYERPKSKIISEDNMYDYKSCLERVRSSEGNILLTTGSNNLDLFSEKDIRDRIYARVLPSSSVIKKCEDLGFSTGNIIAIRGPFSKEMNSLMIKELNIKLLITKESSDAGGFKEKIQAARENNIDIIVIKRPHIDMDNVFYTYEDVYDYIEGLGSKGVL